MDLRSSIHDFVARAKELGLQLRSHEADTLSRADLHILEVQLYLLDKDVQRRKETNRLASASESPNTSTPFPPFISSKDKERDK